MQDRGQLCMCVDEKVDFFCVNKKFSNFQHKKKNKKQNQIKPIKMRRGEREKENKSIIKK